MPAAAILAAAALLSLALALHPFTTYPLSLAALARLRPRPVRGEAVAPAWRVAMCVCAYNEAPVIAARIDNMIALRAAVPDLDILVYVDAATDGTAEIVRGYGDAIRAVVSPARQGKTAGMNTLVGMTDADLIVFSDANVMFAPDALTHLLAPFGDATVGCVCGNLIYTGAANATADVGSLYWRLEEQIKDLESRTGSIVGADGSIFAIRRRLHHAPPGDLIDDMYVSLSILCAGYRIVRAGHALAYEEAVSRPAEEFRRKIRIACQAFNVHRALRRALRQLSPLDRYKYISHKLLRWMTIYLLALAALCFVLALAVAGAPGAAVVLACVIVAGVAVLLMYPVGPLGKIGSILGAFVATGLGVLRSLTGEKFQTWNPPDSARATADVTWTEAGSQAAASRGGGH
jgi:cellulose synthase/poly-beta-1,6-N-acetylglucosamine synthase-like glycosyltransferase